MPCSGCSALHVVNPNLKKKNNYYLAKLITDIHEIGESGMDDNNHEMHVHQKVITCSYLQIMKI